MWAAILCKLYLFLFFYPAYGSSETRGEDRYLDAQYMGCLSGAVAPGRPEPKAACGRPKAGPGRPCAWIGPVRRLPARSNELNLVLK